MPTQKRLRTSNNNIINYQSEKATTNISNATTNISQNKSLPLVLN